MTCVATLARSDPKERGDERLLAVIGFPHAEHMASRATRCVPNHHHPIPEHAETEDPPFSVALRVSSVSKLVDAKTNLASSKSSCLSARALARFAGS
jgi:hypothetical protein